MDRRKDADIKEIKKILMTHIESEEKSLVVQEDDIQNIMRVLHGDPVTGEKGMVNKVNEMYEMLVQAKGAKSLLGIVMLIGGAMGALLAIKTFFIRI
jgi:hypothetical protein